MTADTLFSMASGTQDQLTTRLSNRLLLPNGPATSDHFQVNVEPMFLSAFGLVDGDEIEIQQVAGPENARQYTQWRPAGGRDLILSTRLNSIPVLYAGTYRLRRRVGAAGATVYGAHATMSHEWNGFYTNLGDGSIPPEAVYAQKAGIAGEVAYINPDLSVIGAARANDTGVFEVYAQPFDDSGGSAAQPSDSQVAASTTMSALSLMAIDTRSGSKYRFEFIGYFSCASAGGLRVDILCSNASYCNYSVVIQPTGAAIISDANLASGTAVGGTGFTEAVVRITGFVQMASNGVIVPRFSQQASNATPTTALRGCDINVTERTRY